MNPSQYISRQNLFTRDSHLLVAVSGGKDSMALLHWLHHERYDLSVMHINYHLRDSSDVDMGCVQNVCRNYDIDCYVIEVDTEEIPDSGIQEWARNFRYEAFDKKVEELEDKHDDVVIVTAHHLEDFFETFMIKFLKARLFSSIVGMNNNGYLARPLLQTSVSEIQQYIAKHDIPYVEDESNETDAYLRNKIRHHILPTVAEFMDDYPSQLRLSMQLLSDADHIKNEYMSLLMSQHFKLSDDRYTIKKLHKLSYETRKLFLAHVFNELKINLHPAVLDEMCTSQTGAEWKTENLIILRDRNSIQIRFNPIESNVDLTIDEQGYYETEVGSLELEEIDEEQVKYYKSKRKEIIGLENSDNLQLHLRNYLAGDKIAPLGMNGKTAKVSKILKDNKVNRYDKKLTLVLEDLATGEVIWLIGHKLSENYKYRLGTKPYKLTWRPK